MQPLSTQVLPRSHREQAERRALREQTTSLRTERARLQGELAALRTRLIQVFVYRQEKCLEAQVRAAGSGGSPMADQKADAGKIKVGPVGFSVCTWPGNGEAKEPAPKLQASCRDLTRHLTLTIFEGGEAPWINGTTPDFVTSSAQILGPLGPVHSGNNTRH